MSGFEFHTVGRIVFGRGQFSRAGELAAGLDDTWTFRAVVHQATGMISARLGITLVEALSRLRALAFGTERSLYDIARDVVERRIEVLR